MARTASLSGRIALVTGGTRGIGAAIARRLAKEGARVALLARHTDALTKLAKEIGGGAVGVACDLRDSETLERALGQLHDLVGGTPDIVVNNAAAFLVASVEETSIAAFGDMLAVNLTAPFAVVHTLLPAMRTAGRGHIVTIGSVADRTTFPGNAAYAASKHALRAMHEVVRDELRGSGVRTTLVSPGAVNTELWDPIDPDSKPGFTRRAQMLSAEAVADAVHYVLTAPAELNVDELRLSRS